MALAPAWEGGLAAAGAELPQSVGALATRVQTTGSFQG